MSVQTLMIHQHMSYYSVPFSQNHDDILNFDIQRIKTWDLRVYSHSDDVKCFELNANISILTRSQCLWKFPVDIGDCLLSVSLSHSCRKTSRNLCYELVSCAVWLCCLKIKLFGMFFRGQTFVQRRHKSLRELFPKHAQKFSNSSNDECLAKIWKRRCRLQNQSALTSHKVTFGLCNNPS